MIEALKIIGLCVLAAVIYGIIHDQFTARICLEYFTVFHPPIFGDTQSPTLLAFGWGVVATWWVGLLLGIPTAVCARVGSLPKIRASRLLRPISAIMVILGVLAAVSGCLGYTLARTGMLSELDVDRRLLPPDHFPAFMADAFSHLASYGFGGLLGIGLCVWVLIKRYRAATMRIQPAATKPPAP